VTSPGVVKAVILARGLGTRMRRPDGAAALEPDQAAVADTGMKAMIPIGRPFLDYVLSALATAGFRDVCLVIGPEHNAIRDYYAHRDATDRLRISFAIQQRPLGTADAILAAASFAAGEPFVVINSDNYYPPEVLAALRTQQPPALPAFERTALIDKGNVPPERIASYGILDVAPDGSLRRIIEKPDAETLRALGEELQVSMNCWLFDAGIFDACLRVPPSARGELELPHAVQYAIDHGMRFQTLPVAAPVLDLSSRRDIQTVAAHLTGMDVRL